MTSTITPGQWYRIDASNGSIAPTDCTAVALAAARAYRRPKHAIASGRFRTTFAIYSDANQLTSAERAILGEHVPDPD